MRRFFIILLCCIFFSYDSVLLAANNKDIKNELDKIFFSGLAIDQIVDHSTSDSEVERVSSDEFFKDWYTLEYFEFLSLLNDLFQQKDTTPRYFIQQKIFSKLLEIFGGIYTQQFIQQNGDDWYFPEGILDRIDFILTQYQYHRTDNQQYSLGRHDGAIFTIDGKSITVKKILEVKPSLDSYKPSQTKRVLSRWIDGGINIANMFFPYENITNLQDLQIYLDELNNNRKVNDINSDHNELILIYTVYTLEHLHFKKNDSNLHSILETISERICDRLFESGFDKILDNINNQFVNLLVNLCSAYIDLTKLIPSITSLTMDPSSVHNPKKKYCIEHRKNFVVTFLSIGEDDILWNYVLTTMKKNFSSTKKLDPIKRALSRNKYAVSEPEDIKQQIKEKLIELLGENNKDIINNVVSNTQYYVSTHDPAKDLQHKYRVLFDYFKKKYKEKQSEVNKKSSSSKKSSLSPEEIVQTIILSNLESFLSTTPIEFKIKLLEKLELSIEESYEILIKYFDKLHYIGVIDTEYVNFIRHNIYPSRSESVSNFEVLSFILEHNFESVTEKTFKTFYQNIWNLIKTLESKATGNDSREQKIYNLFHQYFTEHPLLYTSTKDVVRKVILSHPYNIMKNLVIVRLERFLEQLSELDLYGEESYEIMIRYMDFDSRSLNNLDISKEKIKIVMETIPTLRTDFEALCFIFDNKLEYMSADATIKMLCLYIDSHSIPMDELENENTRQNFYYLAEYFSRYLKKDSPSLTLKIQEILAKRPLIFMNTSSRLVKIFLNILSGLRLSLEESVTLITEYFDLDKLNCADISRETIDFIRNQDPTLKSKRDFDILVYIYENKRNILKTANESWIPLAMILSKYFDKHPTIDPSLQIRTIIGSHLDNFTRITPKELNNFLSLLDTLGINGDEAYIIMTQYFDFNPDIINNLDISKEKIDCIKKSYHLTNDYSNFTMLCFMFDNKQLLHMNISQIEQIFNNSDNSLLHFNISALLQSHDINIVPDSAIDQDSSNNIKFANKNYCIIPFSKLPPPDDSTFPNNIQ